MCLCLSLLSSSSDALAVLIYRARSSSDVSRDLTSGKSVRAASRHAHAADAHGARARFFPLLFSSLLFLSLSLTLLSAYNDGRVCALRRDDDDVDEENCDNDCGNDGRRARARALSTQGPCLSSARAGMCVCARTPRLARPDVRDVTARRRRRRRYIAAIVTRGEIGDRRSRRQRESGAPVDRNGAKRAWT